MNVECDFICPNCKEHQYPSVCISEDQTIVDESCEDCGQEVTLSLSLHAEVDSIQPVGPLIGLDD